MALFDNGLFWNIFAEIGYSNPDCGSFGGFLCGIPQKQF